MYKNYCLYLTFDDRYIDGAIITIYSFLKNNKWFNGDIVIASSDENGCILSDFNREKICELYDKVRFIDIDSKMDLFMKLNKIMDDEKHNRFGPILYKLYAFTLKEYNRIVIIDADFLVKDDIRDIFFSKELKFGAVPDFIYKAQLEHFMYRINEYFNVGIISIEKSYINEEIIDKCIEAIESGNLYNHKEGFTYHGKFPEQDLLNLVMLEYKDVCLMPVVYNGNGLYNDMYRDDFKCIHYYGEFKPWIRQINHLKSHELWFEYKEMYDKEYNK